MTSLCMPFWQIALKKAEFKHCVSHLIALQDSAVFSNQSQPILHVLFKQEVEYYSNTLVPLMTKPLMTINIKIYITYDIGTYFLQAFSNTVSP